MFARLLADAVEVVEHVRARLGVERVIVLGHSFGSALGLRLARSHPQLVAAYKHPTSPRRDRRPPGPVITRVMRD
ncbi:alpha/beta fold hydrolase [Streptomyces sp. NPDC059008]|uniref:alpha/beta fold hydrolase n=1 Tax=Streptomyces sp. NPDC059008 TaxID=3346693 RepID=UPI0036B9D3BF